MMDMKDEAPKGGGMKDVAVMLGAPGPMPSKDDADHDPGAEPDMDTDDHGMSPEFEQKAKDLHMMASSKGSAKEFAMGLHALMCQFLEDEG